MSLEEGDALAASAAARAGGKRISLEHIRRKVVNVEFYRPNHTPTMTIATCKLENGFVVIGKSAPADEKNFDAELGVKLAIEDAERQIWQLEGYLLREKLHQEKLAAEKPQEGDPDGSPAAGAVSGDS